MESDGGRHPDISLNICTHGQNTSTHVFRVHVYTPVYPPPQLKQGKNCIKDFELKLELRPLRKMFLIFSSSI